MTDKLGNWEKRGRRSLTIEEIQGVFDRLPLIPVPREILMLDGVIDLEPGLVAVGATPVRQPVMILTPLSDEETVVHEATHEIGFGEIGARALSPVLDFRRRFNMGLMRRQIQFKPAGPVSDDELKDRLRLISPLIMQECKMCYQMPGARRGVPPDIKHYRLMT